MNTYLVVTRYRGIQFYLRSQRGVFRWETDPNHATTCWGLDQAGFIADTLEEDRIEFDEYNEWARPEVLAVPDDSIGMLPRYV